MLLALLPSHHHHPFALSPTRAPIRTFTNILAGPIVSSPPRAFAPTLSPSAPASVPSMSVPWVIQGRTWWCRGYTLHAGAPRRVLTTALEARAWVNARRIVSLCRRGLFSFLVLSLHEGLANSSFVAGRVGGQEAGYGEQCAVAPLLAAKKLNSQTQKAIKAPRKKAKKMVYVVCR